MIFNGYHDVVRFTLPEAVGENAWHLLLDTNAPDQPGILHFAFGATFDVSGRSVLLFLLQAEKT
jgi:glycogen operon protein